jgi:glyoxylase-like metal-dependent hydrolase (beta-lactamase superfamily II)
LRGTKKEIAMLQPSEATKAQPPTEPRLHKGERPGAPDVLAFFDAATSSLSYLVIDRQSEQAAIIDPVLDFDPTAARIRVLGADRLASEAEDRGLTVDWVLDTHIHADHVTASGYLKFRLGGQLGIGSEVTKVQAMFAEIYNAGPDFKPDGSQFDKLFVDGERFKVGNIPAIAMHTPGHTVDSVAYVIGDAVFVGDTLMMPDYGTARCDFPGADARTMYHSIQRLFDLPPGMRMFVLHDYAPNGRVYEWETTVAAQASGNIQIREGVGEDEFVALRTARDKTLTLPAQMLSAIQINMRAGSLPTPESNGQRYLKIPVDRF